MGEVVSFAKASQSDIFSMFDAVCPALPEETNREVVETVVRSVGGVKADKKKVPFSAACMLIAVVSLCGITLLLSIKGSGMQQRASVGIGGTHKESYLTQIDTRYPADGVFSSNYIVTEEFTVGHDQADKHAWRNSREAWLAEIAALESHPYYQQVVKEKRLFSLAHPDQP